MDKLQKFARITALAFSVVFELMAGPFLGYFIGIYLTERFGMSGMAVSIGVMAGFFAGLAAAMLTIMRMGKIEAKKDQTSD